MKNSEIFKDKIVLDIGCGTGILSIFAAKAGAKHVYGIEFADIADYAKVIIKENNLEDKITILKSKVEETNLPVEKVDIIISEWMGYFLLYESMMDTVLYARDKWLNKDGYILPDKASITVAALEDVKYKKEKLTFWDKVYDIDMTCFKPTIIADPLIEECPRRAINSSLCKVFDVDLYTVKKEELDFASQFELTFYRDDMFSGIVAWFDCVFSKLPNKFKLSTSPFLKTTHWKHTIFYTNEDYPVKKDEKLTGSICARKSESNFRAIDVKILFNVGEGPSKKSWTQLYKIA
ncbi:MAG: class I SAM-dependent methyltransferase [archaeon]|nr:class I SAM-dependent methyltransferase [archaeon]